MVQSLYADQDWDQMKLSEAGRQIFEKQNSCQLVKHAEICSDLLQTSKRDFGSSGFDTQGTCNVASTVTQLETRGEKEERQKEQNKQQQQKMKKERKEGRGV